MGDSMENMTLKARCTAIKAVNNKQGREIAVLVSRVTKLEDEAIDALNRIRALEAKGE